MLGRQRCASSRIVTEEANFLGVTGDIGAMTDKPPVLHLMQHPQAVEVGERWQAWYPGVDLVSDGDTRDRAIAQLRRSSTAEWSKTEASGTSCSHLHIELSTPLNRAQPPNT